MNIVKRIFLNFRFGLKGVAQNKIRSFLTLLGILIGIGSVIGMMSLGKGAQSTIISGLESLGTQVITINPGADSGFPSGEQSESGGRFAPPRPGGSFGQNNSDDSVLTLKDYEFLRDNTELDKIEFITPVVTSQETITFEGNDEEYTLKGINGEYTSIYTLEVEQGELFTDEQLQNQEQVIVVGSTVFKDAQIRINSTITIDSKEFTVIGILTQTEESLFGTDTNAEVLIPYTLSPAYDKNNQEISSIAIKVFEEDDIEPTTELIEMKLAEYKDEVGDESEFSVTSILALVDQVEQITDTFTLLLAGIAGISLLVGGIGISNVMLITVTERTREIGIRKAVGAKRSDILLQFLFEAILLTLIGGAAGIIFGIFLGNMVGNLMEFPSMITADSIILATGISVAIGIIFGILPANTASKKSPIEALRYE